MYCNKCGNEIKDGERFCGKCGNSIGRNKNAKKEKTINKVKIIKIKPKILIILFIIIVVCIAIFNKNGSIIQSNQITGEKVIEILETSGEGSKLIQGSVELIGTENITYDDYDKLLIYVYQYDKGFNRGGLILYNTKEDKSKIIDSGGNLPYLIAGLYEEKEDEILSSVIKTINEFITKYEINSLSYGSDNYMKLGEDIGKATNIIKCRKAIENGQKKLILTAADTVSLSSSIDELIYLYERNNIFAKYLGSMETTQQDNWSRHGAHPAVVEGWDRSTRKLYEQTFGPQYINVKKFVVYDFDNKEIGKYDSVEKAKTDLDVEEAGNLNVNQLDYNIQINQNGSMNIVETWDIYISEINTSEINKLFRKFELDSNKYSSISNVKIKNITTGKELSQIDEEMEFAKDCYYALPIEDKVFEIAWDVGLDDSSGTAKYEISYTINDIITVYNDCSELNWRILDTGNSIDNITGIIKLPQQTKDLESLNAWIHGPSNGEIHITSNDTIEFNVSELEIETMLEVRIVIEESIFEQNLKTVSENKLDSILKEEI